MVLAAHRTSRSAERLTGVLRQLSGRVWSPTVLPTYLSMLRPCLEPLQGPNIPSSPSSLSSGTQ